VNVLVVSGIWPPDVGGPASHAPEVADYLVGRGHGVEVVTTAAAPPAPTGYRVHWVSRAIPKGLIHARVAALVRRRARQADVVYTTGMFGRSFAGSTAAARPYVVKLTADPAFERARRRGIVEGDVDAFQRSAHGLRAAALRLARDVELRRAAHVFCPSAYLRDIVLSWGIPPERVSVLPNPYPALPHLRPRDELRESFDLKGRTLAFAGRLSAQKSLDVALAALAEVEDVTLVIAGDGDRRVPLERRAAELGVADRVHFLGAQSRDRVLELFRAADAALLSSSWENFPHTVVEALAVGTPLLATRVGGVGEIVHDGENGLLVPAGDRDALAESIRRFFDDDPLRERLRAAAAGSVRGFDRDEVFARLERALEEAAHA
jgi:glycosyltransferase involved in cell wall biosynthesis